MDYIDARTLSHQNDNNRVLSIFEQLTSALNMAHQNQIFHCDLSPENILINNTGQITLIDFGFSKSHEKYSNDRIPLIHTSQYIPPDTVLNATSDVYSSGLLLYYILTGQKPNKNKVLTKDHSVNLSFNEKYKPSALNSSCNDEIDNIILKAIADNQSERFANMSQMLEAIKIVLSPKEFELSDEDIQLRDKLSIEIKTNQGDTNTYFFCVENENLVKLGDGTYGVVYQIWNKANKFKAVKLLYEHQLPYKVTEWKLSEIIIDEFFKTFITLDCEVNREQIAKMMSPTAELGEFLKKLLDQQFLDEKTERSLEKDELLFLLSHTQKTSQSVALKRFQYEMESSAIIRKTFKNQKKEMTGVISIEGGTDVFHNSDAYKNVNFISIIQKQNPQMRLSNYALVMPYYKWTLKDLLENRYIQVDNELKEDQSGKTGYDLLKKMNFEQRIATIIPFIEHIVTGIKALHMADMFHHDIKPANIFVTTNTADELISVVGDLGFLKTDDEIIEALSSKTIFGWPLGTKHYRSPEQKDNIDIHDIKIVKAGNSGSDVKLIIQDPKFRDSIMDEGDLVSFSNDSSYTFYKIKEVETDANPPYLLIEDPQKKLNKIAQNMKTHIVMHKKQSHRTDYFGIGAIIFDMLTCGKSPERFYDNIRIYDIRDDDNADVLNIKEKYRQISKYELDQPGIVDMFNCFKHETDSQYAPVEIVEIILKCMLYNAKNTYYQSETDEEALDQILNSLFSLYGGLDKKFDRFQKNNPLISRTTDGNNQHAESSNMTSILKNLINRPFTTLPSRLSNGVWYIKHLSTLIQQHTDCYFYELLPEIIYSSSKDLIILYPTYKTKEDYLDDLINDNIFTRIRQSNQNSFIPFDIANIRREIFLKPKNDHKYEYYFDKKYGCVKHGDWIIINSQLFSIECQEEENQHEIKLCPHSDSQALPIEYQLSDEAIFNIKSELDDANESIFNTKYKNNELEALFKKNSKENFENILRNCALDENINQLIIKYSVLEIKGIFYKQLNPCNYYLKMLASYLYTIFFVKNNYLSVDQPIREIYENQSLIDDIFPLVTENTKKTILDKALRDKNNEDYLKDNNDYLIDLYKWVTYIYVRLHFSEDPHSYYNCDENFKNYNTTDENDADFKKARLTSVIEDIDKLIRMIANVINKKFSEFDQIMTNEEAIQINKNFKFSTDMEKHIDFTGLFKDIVENNNTEIIDEQQDLAIIPTSQQPQSKMKKVSKTKKYLKSMKKQFKLFSNH